MALADADLETAAQCYGRAMLLSHDPQVAAQATALAIAIRAPSSAKRALHRWRELGARPAAWLQLRAKLALNEGHTQQAKQQLARLTRHHGKQVWRAFSRILRENRDPAAAAYLLKSLATPARLPPDPATWLAMSQLGERLGRYRYALRIADAAVQRFHRVSGYTWAAQLRSDIGDDKAAMRLLGEAWLRYPQAISVRLAYADVLRQHGAAGKAVKVLENGPQNSATYLIRATLAARAKDTGRLRRIYGQLGQAPHRVQLRSAYLLGQLAEWLKCPEAALKWYRRVGVGDPRAFDAALRRIVLPYWQGKVKQVHRRLVRASVRYRDQPEKLCRIYKVNAELYLDEQRYAKAVAAFDQALQVAPDNLDVRYGRALAYAALGYTDQAVTDFHQLLKRRPGDVNVSNALGYTLANANRKLPEARKLLAAARTARPDDPFIADSWGWLQFRLGHFAQAVSVLRTAWQRAQRAAIGAHLAEVLWRQGHHHEARQVFAKARRRNAHDVTLQDTLRRLRP